MQMRPGTRGGAAGIASTPAQARGATRGAASGAARLGQRTCFSGAACWSHSAGVSPAAAASRPRHGVEGLEPRWSPQAGQLAIHGLLLGGGGGGDGAFPPYFSRPQLSKALLHMSAAGTGNETHELWPRGSVDRAGGPSTPPPKPGARPPAASRTSRRTLAAPATPPGNARPPAD